MRLSHLDTTDVRFRTNDAVRDEIRHACASNADLAEFHDLGRSEKGQSLYGVTLGHGSRTVTLKAGAHADEPVGPETLRLLILGALAQRDWLADGDGFADLFERFTFRVVPHVNPDGEVHNQPWIEAWPDVEAYLRHRIREQPGRDVEFGYPVMREENRVVSRFLFDYSPLTLHMSLHGMGFSEGAMLLIERHWVGRTERLREDFVAAASEAGLAVHDHDRGSEKGFEYIGPGFWTTPEGTAMRRYFRDNGDFETARNFYYSSMELARIAGYDAERRRHPLALVTELPLFVIERAYEREPGLASAYLALKDELPELKRKLQEGQSIERELAAYELRPLDIGTAVQLQLRCIELGLDAVDDEPLFKH